MTTVTDADPNGPALGASRVGAELRAARQRLGWALPDVAAALRIRLPFLEAIEDGRVADLPGSAYAVGFVRAYASSLGLDPAEVARRFRAEAHEVNRKTELAFPAPVPQRGVPAGAVILLGVLLAGGAYVGWYRMSGDTRSAAPVVPTVPERLAPLADRAAPPSNPSPQVASILPPPSVVAPAAPVMPVPAAPSVLAAPPPPPVAAAPPPPPPAPVNRLVVHMKTDGYVQVREAQGPVLLNRVLRAGESWPVPKGAPVLLTTSNAGAVELVIDGVAGPALGAAGLLRRDVPLDPDAPKQPPSTGRTRPQ